MAKSSILKNSPREYGGHRVFLRYEKEPKNTHGKDGKAQVRSRYS